jgi:tetratricopeptide (TPR) repeat protein
VSRRRFPVLNLRDAVWDVVGPGMARGGAVLVALVALSPAFAPGARAEGDGAASPAATTNDSPPSVDDRGNGQLAGDVEVVAALPGIAFYEALAKKEPQQAEHHQLLAVAYARQGRVDDARRSARRAIELAPSDPEVHQALGLIEEGADKLATALPHFEKAASLDGNVEYRLDVARVLSRMDRRADADAAYAAIAAAFSPPALTGDAAAEVQMALGDSFRGLGRYDDAAAAWDRAATWATSTGKQVDALVEKSRMLADRADTAGALDALLKARALAPADADVHYNLGALYVRARQLDAAVGAFDAALKERPDFAHALNNKGVALERQQKLDEAQQAFAGAVAIDGRNTFARYNLGLVLFKQRKFAEAEAAFEAVLKVDPEQADAKFFLGEIYFQLGETKKALRLYKEALRSNPDDGTAHGRLGDLHLAAGELDLAIGEYWAAVDADKNAANHRTQLMRVLLVRNGDGDARRAVKLGEEGLELDPAALDVRVALAAAETQYGRSPRAQEILEAGVARAPNDARTHTALGRHLLERGKVADAQASFGKALAMDARHAPALAGDGDAALSQGDTTTAQKRFEQALDVDPTLADARAELGYILFKADRNKDAIAALTRATDDDARLGKAWFYLAFAQFKAGDEAAVETSLKRAVAVQPDLAEAWLQLGKLQLRQGKKDDAKKSFVAAEKARGGTYEEARLELERLQ